MQTVKYNANPKMVTIPVNNFTIKGWVFLYSYDFV